MSKKITFVLTDDTEKKFNEIKSQLGRHDNQLIICLAIDDLYKLLIRHNIIKEPRH